MYCPRCGQQQASDSVRFCSRCGFRLALVTELLYNDGLLPATDPSAPSAGRSEKRRPSRQGVKMMFISGVVFPVCLGFSILADTPGPLLIPFTLFLAGLAWLLYFQIFGDDVAPAEVEQPRRFNAPQQRVSLPPSQEAHIIVPAPRRVDTADMEQPPSVTDHTTRFFEEK